MTSDEFANTVLEPVRQLLETAPYVAMRHKKSERAAREGELRIVSELAGEDPNRKTAFLLGQEPHWSDLVTERAIKRDIDAQLFDLAMGGIGGKKSTTVAVTGTAGSGKSASLMRVCLGLSNGGHKVGYVDRDTDISPQQIRRQLAEGTDITVLAIDDADRYGEYMMPLVDEMSRLRPGLLTILGVRSSRSDALDASMLRYSQLREVSIPHLSDSDIDGLIDTLERNSLLGRLKGKDRETQRQLFKRESGRQLLVAMIQATSGRKFEEKISEELDDYGDEERFLYGLVAVVSDRNLSIAKEELLIASGHPDNDTLNRLERLTRRGAIVEREGRFTTRHREIARVLVERFAAERTLDALIGPIVFAVASTVSQSGHRNSREWRILKRLLSHRHLARVVNDPPRVRGIFERVETLLGWDYHMWLQRGAFEVQQGDLALAENYLGQAFALNDEDSLVVTEYAHLGFRIALENPRSPKAAGRISDATEVLETQIREQGDRDFYPYHVLGSQGLAWSRRAGMGREERRLFLKRILAHVEEGVLRHPHQTDLADLQRDLKREVLLTHVV
jgi:DNA-binding MarR family transcriptional regulator